MKHSRCLFYMIFMAMPLYSIAQASDAITKGNQYYRDAHFDLAERQYREAINADSTNTTAQYNLANALYKQRKFSEATIVLQKMRGGLANKEFKGTAHYNEGVIYSKQKDLEKSIDAYKDALRNNPNDKEARENLQKALLELKKQQQDKQKKQQQQQPSRMSEKEAQQKLEQLQQKEQKIQERLQNKGQKGSSQPKDW